MLLLMLLSLNTMSLFLQTKTKMFNYSVNFTDYMHKKCCEIKYSLYRDIIIYDMS